MASLWPSPSGKWTKISFSDDISSRAYREDVTKCVLHNDSDVDSDEDDAWMSQLEKDYDSSRRRRKRRTWTMYERRVTTALSVFVTTTVVLALLILSFFRKDDPVCLTRACVQAANELSKSLNDRVNPCDDFYQYACGAWERDTSIPIGSPKFTSFHRIAQKNQLILKRILDRGGLQTHKSSAVRNVATYYTSCLDQKIIESRGAKPLQDLIKLVGSWTVTNTAWNPEGWNFGQALTQIHKLKSMPLFYMFVGPDDKDSSRNIIQIQQAGITLPDEEYYNRKDNDKLIVAYKDFMVKTAMLLGANDKANVIKQMNEVLQFERNVAKIYEPKGKLKDSENIYNKMTIADLQQMAPSIPWMDYMNNIFSSPVTFSEPVVVYTPHYLRNMSELVTKTERRVLANYMVWHLIKPLVHLLSQPFREAYDAFEMIEKGSQPTPPSTSECVARSESLFGFATGMLYVKERYGKEAKSEASEMIKTIKEAFERNIPRADWMDESTKEKALEKLNAVIEMIGYPSWIEDISKLDNYYSNLTMKKDSHFENYLDARRFYHAKMMSKRSKLVERSEWHLTPSEVNAYYNTPNNYIAFPLGILQRPFFEPSWPKYLNYGAIGVIMGHELTHGFDSHGSKFDKYGNLNNWWRNGSLDRFQQRVNCMVEQYGNFTSQGKKIDGTKTLAENIADNGGLKLAFQAYKDWLKRHQVEQKLPSFDLTPKQLFFVAFAQVWCSSSTETKANESLLTDDHSPERIRVLAAVHNSQDFADAFNCPLNSPMNPSKKCEIW
ncbi:endothelin-converting enzyme 1-like [Paramuricea clavata]|uniref:Endothelin-converting enzyme 1-like n=1 Tax=Paramuricea clavata TaxID=317549 RepID=A0A6S7H2K1_PARCT|nr:endothelin-converting enzyme 1-like [Paramuricea clavata]